MKKVRPLLAKAIPIEWHPGLPVYASERFLREVGDEYGWLGGIDQAGQLQCILPYTILRKTGFRIVRYRVETIPLIDSFDIPEEQSFLTSTVQYFRSLGADMIIPGSNTSLFRTYPTGALAAPYGTVINDLNGSEETLFKKVQPDFRNKIRRAIKAKVEVDFGVQYLDEAYELIAATLQRSDMRFKDRETFRRQVVNGLGENVMIAVAKQEGKTQACFIAPYSRFAGYSWYTGTIAAPAVGAMHLLQWEVIRKLSHIGVRRFNFTGVRVRPEPGSKQEGIANFKLRFGGQLVEGYMWKIGLRRLKFAAYQVAMRLLKGGDTVDCEQHKMAALS